MTLAAGDVAQVEQAVLAYLAQYPEAGDTVEGIAEWWLPETGGPFSLQLVQRALDRLVAAERLICKVMPGGAVIYFAAAARN